MSASVQIILAAFVCGALVMLLGLSVASRTRRRASHTTTRGGRSTQAPRQPVIVERQQQRARLVDIVGEAQAGLMLKAEARFQRRHPDDLAIITACLNRAMARAAAARRAAGAEPRGDAPMHGALGVSK
jgi:hypothetical protein